jgi:recombination protein RecA
MSKAVARLVAPWAGGRRAEALLPSMQPSTDPSADPSADASGWALTEVVGRLCELGGPAGAATLTLAFGLVLDAQERGEPVAWVTGLGSAFYPPDVADSGIDLQAMAVVRLADPASVPRAAAELARSGGFGLVVLDLGRSAAIPMPLQSRLLGLAQKHGTAIVCLLEKQPDAPSLGSLISLRGEARRGRHPQGGFLVELYVLKDKRRAPGWAHQELCRGPAGLR